MSKIDVYEKVTNAIIQRLEASLEPWRKGSIWSAKPGANMSLPVNFEGRRYSGVNILLLWGALQDFGYTSNRWMTYRKAAELGGQVRKGEKSQFCVFVGQGKPKSLADVKAKRGEPVQPGDDKLIDAASGRKFLKQYAVFNVDQIDNLPDRFRSNPEPILNNPNEHIDYVRDWFDQVGAEVRHGGDRAYYTPSGDYIQMPPLAAFADTTAYYGTLGHELVHWTGTPKRLDRESMAKYQNQRPMEELTAEIGGAFLCALLGLEETPRDNHAAYVKSWVAKLRDDKTAIMTAASQASKAVDYLDELARANHEQKFAA